MRVVAVVSNVPELTTLMAKKNPQKQPAPPPVEEPEVQGPAPLSRRTIACAGCAGAFVLVLIIAVVVLWVWDAKDGRQFNGKPLPTNVAYIGGSVSDQVVGARIDTFAITGSKLACDFAVSNDSQQPITVKAIGRTIVAPAMDTYLVTAEVPLTLCPEDQPMLVTDEENVSGLQMALGSQWVPFKVEANADAAQPQPFTLKPGETKRLRYRPPWVSQYMSPASALRIAVLLDDAKPPHPFYFLRKSAGIGGFFEKGMATAVERGSERR